MRILLSLLVALCVIPKARADLLVQVEVLEVSHKSLIEILKDSKLVKADQAFREHLQRLVEGGAAELVDYSAIRLLDGAKGSFESGREYIYRSEYEPSPILLTGSLLKPRKKSPYFAEEPLQTPTYWDMNPTGSFVTVEPNLQQAGFIDLRLEWQKIALLGEDVFTARKTGLGNEDRISQPIFDSNAVTRDLALRDGKYGFVGVFRNENRPDHRELVFVKCDRLE